MQGIRNFVVGHLWWLVVVAALAMLVAHSLGVKWIVVDNTSLVLLALILISPFVPAIKKIKIGEFEAEIEPDEVKRATELAEKSLPETPSPQMVRQAVGETASAIKALVETDPVVALAKLRIEFESRLRRLHHRVRPETEPPARPPALNRLIRDLAANEAFSPEFGTALRDVIAICNRAIHGEDIRDVDAKQIVETGIDSLEALAGC